MLKNYNGLPIRLIGVSLQNLSKTKAEQLSFLNGDIERGKQKKVVEVMDAIKTRYGEEIITYAKVKEKEPDWGRSEP